MLEVWFAIPGDLAAPTGGYAYAREILARFADHGIAARHVALPAGYPFPAPNDLAETERLISEVPRSAPLMIDGLAFGAMPTPLVAQIPQPLVALVHHPLALETGLTTTQVAELERSEAAALSFADAVIATSPTTVQTLEREYGVPAGKLISAEPGAPKPTRASGSGPNAQSVALLAVGAASQRKGYDLLIEALARQPRAGWHLTIAGSLERAPQVVGALKDQIRMRQLGDHVHLVGAVSDRELDALFDACDLFVHSARYEGYGMVLTEALSRGLAMVATTGGAAAQTVPDGAAMKVPPDDVDALARALDTLIADEVARSALSERAWAAAAALPTWDDTTAAIAQVLKKVAA